MSDWHEVNSINFRGRKKKSRNILRKRWDLKTADRNDNWISRKVAGNISVKGNTVSVLTDSEFKMLEADLKNLGTDCKRNNG